MWSQLETPETRNLSQMNYRKVNFWIRDTLTINLKFKNNYQFRSPLQFTAGAKLVERQKHKLSTARFRSLAEFCRVFSELDQRNAVRIDC